MTAGARLELSSGGSFTGPFTAPVDSPEGENQVWAYCISEGGAAMAGPIAGVFGVDNSLPPTGAPLTVVALAGIGALVVGLALVIPARQRSRANR
jgi:hypothetical protein